MKKKKILAAVLAALLLVGAGLFSGVLIRRAAGTKAALVPVYSVEGLCLKGWTGSVSVPVTVASGSSSIYSASSERPVSELYVEAGQSVEAGQPLFQYDTSGLLRELEGTELTLENQRTYLGRLGAYIEELKGELPSAGQGGASPSAGKDGLLSMKAAGSVPVAGGLIYIVEENAPEGEAGSQPGETLEGETGSQPNNPPEDETGSRPDDPPGTEQPAIEEQIDEESVPRDGDGSEENPYIYDLKKGGTVTAPVLAKLIRLERHARFHVVDEEGGLIFTWEFDGKAYEEAVKGELEESTPAAEESTPAPEESTPAPEESTPVAEESTPAAEESTPAPEESTPAAEEPGVPDFEGSFDDGMLEDALTGLEEEPQGYTKEELARMISERAMEYENLELAIKRNEKAAADLRDEIDGCTVYAKEPCQVQESRSPAEAVQYGQPMLVCAVASGRRVEGQLNEILASELSVGDQVSIPVTIEGKESSIAASVSYIGREPIEGAAAPENPNLSVYAFSASIEEGAAYRPEEIREVQLPAAGAGEERLVLPADWIFYENGLPHVYARAEDGSLVLRKIETGRSILGDYLEVVSGVSREDYLADPSGEGVKEGAYTEAVYGEEMEIGPEEESGGEDG